jgi:exodeoxyribonuclease VII large subunit
MHLQKEFKRLLDYKFEQYEIQLPVIKQSFEQNLSFILQNKEQHLEYVRKKIEMNDPKLQCKKGWVQISSHGKPVTLDSIDVNEKFIVTDAFVKIEALCLEKKDINS